MCPCMPCFEDLKGGIRNSCGWMVENLNKVLKFSLDGGLTDSMGGLIQGMVMDLLNKKGN